ncbi:MAG: hypothetical protein GY696_03510, partial [Gammaproteobacteria bacterium]|nr:hypothetical protein [Gammaproteobacteria bacterium]
TGWKCFLIAAKCKVAPKLEVTMPRMELMAAQIGHRLANKIIESMTDLKFKESVFLTDLSAVFGMLSAPSGSLSIFAGHRGSEIKAKSGPTRWLWVPTLDNISDLGTRCTATPADLGPGSAWQDGPSWLQLPESSWPTKDNIHGEVPAEETKPSRIALGVSAEPESQPIESEEPPDAAPQKKPPDAAPQQKLTPGWFPIKKYSCLRFAKKVMVRILKAADEFKMGLENTDLATGRIRTTNHELRAYAHTLLIA